MHAREANTLDQVGPRGCRLTRRICAQCAEAFAGNTNAKYCSLGCYVLANSEPSAGGCRNWMATKVHGYGQFTFHGKKWRAHRAAHTAFKGEIADGMCVCHRCDNRACVNPDHLFLGTTQENTEDKVRKGRQNHSQNHARAKLRPDQVRTIRLDTDTPHATLARRYGVTPQAILLIRRRVNWKHAP